MSTITHFHCGWCDSAKTCDCQCTKCIKAKEVTTEKEAATAAKPTGGAAPAEKEWQCWNCGAYGDEDCRRGCLEERVDIRNAEAAAEKHKADAATKKKGCTCEEDDEASLCDFCHYQENNRCGGCGAYPDEKCHKDCNGGIPEECQRCGRVDCWC